MKNHTIHILLDWFRTIAIALVLAFLLNTFVLGNVEVFSVSMDPTLVEGNRIFTSRLAYRLEVPQRGDVVVLDPPVDPPPAIPYIKRVIGLPGEQLDIQDGQVWINGHQLAEPYAHGTTTGGQYAHLKIPVGNVFVMGDNREHSSDSRSFGPVAISDLRGKALMRYWPLDALRTF